VTKSEIEKFYTKTLWNLFQIEIYRPWLLEIVASHDASFDSEI